MKQTFFLLALMAFNFNLVLGQEILRIIKDGSEWAGKDGYICLDIPKANEKAILPEEFKNLELISIFNVPFQIKPETAGKFCTTREGTEKISLSVPPGTREILFLMFADFPKDEIAGCWESDIPLNILSEPERALITLEYSDGTSEEIIPVNADFKCYGITHGRALYSVVAKKGKTISKMFFNDNMRNASFQIIAVTANTRLLPRIAEPVDDNLWYQSGNKVALSGVTFQFDTSNGFAWNRIESEMLPKSIELAKQPVFIMTFENMSFPSTEWEVKNVSTNRDTITYLIGYARNGLNLEAKLKAVESKKNELVLSLQVTNLGNDSIQGTLFFPVISNLKIGNVAGTWYAYARNGLIVNKMNCSYHDYLGSEKPLQYDGVFNPEAGVGLGIFPRDTTDFFRWYNFSKDNDGVNYALEYAPETKKKFESWKSIPVALAVIPGDWKDQFNEYKNWLSTWYRKSTPALNWFNQVFAFAYFDLGQHGNLGFIEGAANFHDRFGYLDYFHIFAWAKTEKFGHWGDYSHYESVGSKKEFTSTIEKFQNEKNIPVGLYLDGYLITDQAENLNNQKKLDWAIKESDGKPFRNYNSFVECLYVKSWRDFIIERFREVSKVTGAKGMYCDELGMSLRSRVCYDSSHGHPIPYYMAQGENLMMKEIKAVLPDVAIYNEFGGTDVMTQFNDGGLTYITAWNSYSPEQYNVTGNVPYGGIAPHYLDLRRFAFPGFKTFDVILTQVPWENGNWSLGKFPFFNGNSYFHRVDDGKDGDEAAIIMMRKIRLLQNDYKLEFSSTDVEPLVPTIYPNTFANRFSTEKRDVYTLFNANYRTAKGAMLKVKHNPGVKYKDVWNNRDIEILEVNNGMATLKIEMAPREVICVVSIKNYN